MSASRWRIAVLAGGDSPERDISLQSGRAVVDALRSAGHQILQIDPASDDLSSLQDSSIDVVLPMVHGTGGEDGVLQATLESYRIPFVGSDSSASALTFDKIRCQEWLHQQGIAVPESVVIRETDQLSSKLSEVKALGFPLAVKPSQQGSSVGVSIVDQLSLIATAVHIAAGFGGDVLIERFIPGREVTVPVVDGELLPAVEVLPAGKWYDYRSKYMDQRTKYRILEPDDLPIASEIAQDVCQSTGVAGICRVDLRVTDSADARVLEVNTIPGMTSHSLVPMSAAHRGQSLAQLCEQVIAAKIGSANQSAKERGAA